MVWLSVGMERRKKRTNIHIEEEMSTGMMIFCLYSYWRATNKNCNYSLTFNSRRSAEFGNLVNQRGDAFDMENIQAVIGENC